MNSIILSGNLVRDPEDRDFEQGGKKTTFRLAVARRSKEGDTDYFDIVSWGKLAETCNTYLKKGRKVIVRGRLQNRSYEKDGQKRTVTEIIADDVEFLSAPEKHEEEPKPIEYKQADLTMVEDDDLPF